MGDFDTTNIWGLLVPAVCLAALGLCVPKALARIWPEGVGWLMGLALVSAVVMTLLGALVFAGLYAAQGVDLADLHATQGAAAVAHFVRLSLMSALLWLPLMVMSLVYVPRGWVREVW